MSGPATRSPDWDHLFEIGAAQEGLFTARQAAEAGYSPQLLAHHLGAGRMSRVRRGVYRIVHFPAGDHEDLTAIWLWSDREGVFSHQTALALHDLSDVLPAQVHLTLPEGWRKRRLRVPDGVVVDAVAPDGVIEGIEAPRYRFCLGVQWHPEFQDGRDPRLLPADPLMRAFLDAARR